MISNYQAVKELKKIVDDDLTRYRIEYLVSCIGSYKARKEHSEDFIQQRQVSGRIHEAKYIAAEWEETLKLFEKYKKITIVLDELRNKASELKFSNINNKEGLYDFLLRFNNSKEMECRAGERLEKRLDKGREINCGMTEREVKKIFREEGFDMLHGLVWEFDHLRNNKDNQ